MCAQEDDIGDQDGEDEGQARSCRKLAAYTQETSRADQHGNRPAEDHDLSVQSDMTLHDGSQAQ